MNERKQKVIDIAKELFSLYGFKKVSMDEIALKSGVTKRTIYKYFKDKDELLKYFIFEEYKKMEALIEGIENKNIDTTEKFHELICSLLDYKKQNKLISAITKDAEIFESKSAQESCKIINNLVKTTIQKRIEKAISEKKFKPCNVDVMTFIIYKVYVTLLFELDENEYDKEEISKTLLSMLKVWLV